MRSGMLVFRSLALGLLGACFLLLAFRPAYEVRFVHQVMPAAEPTTEAPATIVDVAPGLSAPQIASLIALGPDEHVVAVDDTHVTGSLGAGVLIASRDLQAQRYLDLEVEGPSGQRRVLVLLH